MKTDIPENPVKDIAIAVVLEEESVTSKFWNVYLINLQDKPIETTLVSSKGYGLYHGEEVRTSTFRHSLGNVPAGAYVLIEAISEEVFALNNEFWLSYFQNDAMYDKKFIFLTESITESNFTRIPLVNKPGVMIR